MSEISTSDRDRRRRASGPSEHGQALLDISNAVVRIHKYHYGRGPTKARSHLSNDLLTVLLEGGFTRSEQTLLEHGHEEEVKRSRLALQRAVESELRAAVEQILHRRVRSFMSANDPRGGLQAEIFVLDPADAERSPRVSDVAEHDGDGRPGTADLLAERARQARAQHRGILDDHRALRAEQIQSRRKAQGHSPVDSE